MDKKFYFYREFYDVLKELPHDLRDELCMALLDYAFEDKLYDLSPTARIHFAFFKQKIDFIKSRSRNGSLGGRGKWKNVQHKNAM